MSEGRLIFGTAILSAFFVLAVVAPLAYFGMPTILSKLDMAQSGAASDVPSVIMELKAETINEIQTATNRSKEELMVQIKESEERQSAAIREIQQVLVEVQSQQEKLAAEFGALGKTEPSSVPGQRLDTFNQTIFFPLGQVKGPRISAQLNAVRPMIEERAKAQTCVANVLGFSDTLGGDIANLKLSQDRAAYVAEQLKPTGVTIGEVKGWGERWLNEHTPDATKNDKNRRVVIELDCNQPATTPTNPSS